MKTIALKNDGTIVMWGNNEAQQLRTPTVMVYERYSYDAFGNTTIRDTQGNLRTTSAYGNRFMFTGREYDSETGNYYYRARYCKPSIGRFLQPDPIGYAGGLNLYTYCGNNPINYTDPLGLSFESLAFGLNRALRASGSDKNCPQQQGNKPIYLTREEFERRVGPNIRRHLQRSRRGGLIRPGQFYEDAVTNFQHDTIYIYMGQEFTGEEMNYYLQGILMEHYRAPRGAEVIYPLLHNWWFYDHLPSTGEYLMTIYGRRQYHLWVDGQNE
jgi:RHS repeat-associated protein